MLQCGQMLSRSVLLAVFLSLWNNLPANASSQSTLSIKAVRVPNGGIQPQAVADLTGRIHLLYYSGDPGYGDLYYTISDDEGQTWSRPLRVNSRVGTAVALGTIRGGQMAIGRNHRVYVLWNGSSEVEGDGPLNPESGKRGMPLLYTRLNDAANAFEPERNLMTHTFGLDGGAAITADGVGDVYVAWHAKAPGAPAGEAGRQVWVTKSINDGKTFSSERPATTDPTGACGCCGMASYSALNGDLYTLYRSATQDVHRDIYLLASTDRGSTFSNRKLHSWNINACPMSSMSFAERGNKVEGAWETGGQVYFQEVTKRNAQPVSAPGPNKGHKHPRISIASNGDTLLVWTEGTGWGRGGSLAWQAYDSTGSLLSEHGSLAGLPAWSFAAVAATRNGFLVLY
jgi:hypothetical protein